LRRKPRQLTRSRQHPGGPEQRPRPHLNRFAPGHSRCARILPILPFRHDDFSSKSDSLTDHLHFQMGLSARSQSIYQNDPPSVNQLV
jgi:hypothetical protein